MSTVPAQDDLATVQKVIFDAMRASFLAGDGQRMNGSIHSEHGIALAVPQWVKFSPDMAAAVHARLIAPLHKELARLEMELAAATALNVAHGYMEDAASKITKDPWEERMFRPLGDDPMTVQPTPALETVKCKVAPKGDPPFASNRDPFIPAVRAALRGAIA